MMLLAFMITLHQTEQGMVDCCGMRYCVFFYVLFHCDRGGFGGGGAANTGPGFPAVVRPYNWSIDNSSCITVQEVHSHCHSLLVRVCVKEEELNKIWDFQPLDCLGLTCKVTGYFMVELVVHACLLVVTSTLKFSVDRVKIHHVILNKPFNLFITVFYTMSARRLLSLRRVLPFRDAQR